MMVSAATTERASVEREWPTRPYAVVNSGLARTQYKQHKISGHLVP